MLAQLNVFVLSVWFVAEIVPLLADALARREVRRQSVRDDD